MFKKGFKTSLLTTLGFGMGLFWDPVENPEWKIAKYRGSRSGYEKFGRIPKKILSAKSRKSRNPGDRYMKIPKKILKNIARKSHDPPWVSEFYPRNTGFFKFRGFRPRDYGFFLISGFLSPGFSQNSRDSEFFFRIFHFRDILGIRIFFLGMRYPDKKPPLITDYSVYKFEFSKPILRFRPHKKTLVWMAQICCFWGNKVRKEVLRMKL